MIRVEMFTTKCWNAALVISLLCACGSAQSSNNVSTSAEASPPSEGQQDGLAAGESSPRVGEQNRPSQLTVCIDRNRVVDSPLPCHVFRWDEARRQYFVDNHPIETAQAEEVFEVYSANFEGLGLQHDHGPILQDYVPPRILIEGVCPVAGLTPCELHPSLAQIVTCERRDSPERCAHLRAYEEAFHAVWQAVRDHATDDMGRPFPRVQIPSGFFGD